MVEELEIFAPCEHVLGNDKVRHCWLTGRDRHSVLLFNVSSCRIHFTCLIPFSLTLIVCTSAYFVKCKDFDYSSQSPEEPNVCEQYFHFPAPSTQELLVRFIFIPMYHMNTRFTLG